MISPINFTGIKNIGYARILGNNENNLPQTRVIMNMELTDDSQNKDLTNFRQILKKYPFMKNEVNDKYINVEYDLTCVDNLLYSRVLLNGHLVKPEGEGGSLVNFARNLVSRVKNFKINDFKLDKNHHLSEEAQVGLVYNDNIDNYIDGTSGELDLLSKTGLIEKFDLFLNDESIELSKKDEEKVFKALDEVVATLHEPVYVKQNSNYLDALLKTYYPIDRGS